MPFNFDAVDSLVTQAETSTNALLSGVADGCDIGGAFKGAMPSLAGIADSIEKVIGQVTEIAGAALTAIKDAIAATIEGFTGGIRDLISEINSRISDLTSEIAEAIAAGQTALASLLQSAFDTLNSAVSSAISAIQGVVSSINDAISSAVSAVTGAIDSLLSELSSVADNIKISLCGVAKDVVETLGEGVTAVVDGFKDSAEETLTAATEALSLDSAISVIEGVTSSLASIDINPASAISGIASASQDAFAALQASFI